MNDNMNRKKSLILALILGMVIALGGCGKKEEEHNSIVEYVSQQTVTDAASMDADEASLSDASATNASKSDASVTDASSTDADVPAGNGKVIVLDPGHSSKVSGEMEPVGPGSSEMKAKDVTGTSGRTSGLMEYELALQTSFKMKEELERRGYTVYLTRYDNEVMLSCSERAEIANNYNADAFIRVHADGVDDSSASGAMTICITPSNPYVSEMYQDSRRLSEDIISEYCKETGLGQRSIWETDTMTGNNWSKVPTTLLEMGFMTNPNEDALMADPAFQDKIASGVANGLDKFFGFE